MQRKMFAAMSVGLLSLIPSLSHGALLINEVYGGGGNTGAPFTNDFVELYNSGPSSVALDGFKVEYASAAGTSYSGITFPASTNLAAGSFLLIQFGSGGSVGSALPSPFGTTSGTNLSATNGKVRLQNGTISGDATPTATGIIDFVGFGTANAAEGTAAPAGSNTASVSRIANGAVDAQNNSLDFSNLLGVTPGATNIGVALVPEPTTLGLLSLGGLAALRRRRA